MGTLSCVMHAGSSSPSRDGTRAPCIGSGESYPLDHHGSPSYHLSYIILYLYLHLSIGLYFYLTSLPESGSIICNRNLFCILGDCTPLVRNNVFKQSRAFAVSSLRACRCEFQRIWDAFTAGTVLSNQVRKSCACWSKRLY